MNSRRDTGISLLRRGLIAVPFFLLGYFLLFRAGGVGSLIGAYAMGLMGCAGIIAGAIAVAPALARLIAEPTGRLYWPGEEFDGPQAMYGVPQSRRAKGFYEEATAGYEKTQFEGPGSEPYVDTRDKLPRRERRPGPLHLAAQPVGC